MNKTHPRPIRLVAFAFLLLIGGTLTAQDHWIDLFNGKDLTGWTPKGGKAVFKAQNGTIVGSPVLNSPNSFLCTVKKYKDFVLELEFRVDSSMNSGIQIRSLSLPAYQDGRVHGYQVEIDPSARAWTGGIYDEGRRGWLYTEEGNAAARKAFMPGTWNKIRVEAIADTIRTWLNGIPAAWLIDNLTHDGFIALQVHDIGSDQAKLSSRVEFRNIRIMTGRVNGNFTHGPMSIAQVNMVPNTLTKWEVSQGWQLLFDGKTTKGWRGAHMDKFPARGWAINNGCLMVLAGNGGEAQNGGDIVTTEEYSDFDLTVEFKYTKVANSGIKYFVTENEKTPGSAIGLEYQILDDENHPDAKLGNHEGSRTLASLYDLIKAKNKRVNAMGEWNRAEIISRGTHVEHWLNGFKVLEYDRGSPAFRKLVSESKYKVWSNFGEAPHGHILLQDHGSEVSFRSIKLKKL